MIDNFTSAHPVVGSGDDVLPIQFHILASSVQFKYESIYKNTDEDQTNKLGGRGRQVHWFDSHRRQLFV